MGGKVVDEQGRPIAGARVFPLFTLTDGVGEEVASAVSDAQGEWRSDALPSTTTAGKKTRPIVLRVSHPDHATSIEGNIQTAAALAGSVVLTLKARRPPR